MREVFGYICIAGFTVSVLYAFYSMFMKKGERASSSKRMRNHVRHPGRIKESSRILEPRPEMVRPTESDIAIEPSPASQHVNDDFKEAEDAESDEYGTDGDEFVEYSDHDDNDGMENDTGSEIEEKPENVSGEKDNVQGFLSGLDDDLESRYEERQPLSDYDEHVPDFPEKDNEPDDGADLREDASGRQEDVRTEETNELYSDDDSVRHKPTPLDISRVFHRLEKESEAEDMDNREGADETDEETDEDTLFG